MPTDPRGSWTERFTNEGKESVREWKFKKKKLKKKKEKRVVY